MQSPLDNTERQELQEYIDGLENNVEYFKQWAMILETQRDIAESRVKVLEHALIHCQNNLPTTINL
jgi:hypothetical protein